MNRINIIKNRLESGLNPTHLEIIDDSEKHKGHVGNTGAGYYTILVSAPIFKNIARVSAHKKIYAILEDLIPKEIHALSIKIIG